MMSSRFFTFLMVGIVALGVALAGRIYSLHLQVRAKDRIIRKLGGELRMRASALGPLREELSGKNNETFSLRLRIRARAKEISDLRIDILTRDGMIESLRKRIDLLERDSRTLRVRLGGSNRSARGWDKERKRLEEQVAQLAPLREELEEKEKVLASFKAEKAKMEEKLETQGDALDGFRRVEKKKAEQAKKKR